MSFIRMGIKIMFISVALALIALLWNRGLGQLGNGLQCNSVCYGNNFQYADQLYGPEHNRQGDHPNNSSDDDDDDDVENALAKEVEELKGTVQEKRFQAVLSGANNVIFIKTNLPDSKDSTDLVHTILMDMLKTGCKKTR